jgi:23S rRNA (guanine2535-N1)-methyltransferase
VSYRIALDRHDTRDLASGHVLRSAPGYPAFPVRLAEEMLLGELRSAIT